MPEAADIRAAEQVVESRLVWIYSKLAERPAKQSGDVFRRPQFVNGEGFYFLGRHYRLKLIDPTPDDRRPVAVRFIGEHVLFRRSQVSAGERRIAEFYARAARQHLNEAVRRWKRILGVEPKPLVNIADLGFRWGSCSVDDTLNFHWRIMQLPPAVIDYVVVHELCHLKVARHSPAFWTLVRKALPDYQRHRAWLREQGSRL